ncbi:hypothetical protein M2305_000059 [Gluconobacter cerinus]|uniref:hypothetical protein n=1 Tax=Gluconobacter cerinus TaxID=38307 RepID=UPI002227A953|nr:hypothetical protein [Gluconobacter cerinus]MCW2264112.1 hypothetical protein [Gluconobacter cerinus]
MTQNTEQNVRTQGDQVQWMVRFIRTSRGRETLEWFLREHIRLAEARGAEEQRRKDAATSDEALEEMTVERDNAEEFIRKFAERVLGHSVEWSSSYGFGAAFVDVADRVDALEAEIASLKEAEQLARADAEASKAREEVLKEENVSLARKVDLLNSPLSGDHYETPDALYGVDLEDSLSAVADESSCGDITRVISWRKLGPIFILNASDDNVESFSAFPSREDAEKARAALTREGGA